MPPRVTVTRNVKRPGISARRLTRIVRGTLRLERMPRSTAISVVLVNDPTIRRLNRRFLNHDRATDVLSFPMGFGIVGSRGRGIARRRAGSRSRRPIVPRSELLGEVVISVDRARQQAKLAGHPLRAEIALLAVHGVLHLTGHDDASAAQAARMDRRQRRILRVLGEEVRA